MYTTEKKIIPDLLLSCDVGKKVKTHAYYFIDRNRVNAMLQQNSEMQKVVLRQAYI